MSVNVGVKVRLIIKYSTLTQPPYKNWEPLDKCCVKMLSFVGVKDGLSNLSIHLNMCIN